MKVECPLGSFGLGSRFSWHLPQSTLGDAAEIQYRAFGAFLIKSSVVPAALKLEMPSEDLDRMLEAATSEPVFADAMMSSRLEIIFCLRLR
jgi:hypothetical protein